MASLQTLSAAAYRKIEAVSASRLKQLDRSPAHLRWALDHPEDSTPAMDLGTAIHCAVLEPERFAKEYAIGPECDLRYSDGKALWKAFQEEHPGKTHLRADDGATVREIVAGVERCDTARMLLRNEGASEESVLWEDPETGLACKARADKRYLSGGGWVIVDLKSVVTAAPDKLRYKIVSDGWFLQDAHYRAGFDQIDAGHRMVFVCYEKKPPFACCVVELAENARSVSESERMRLMHLYRRCTTKNEWPDWSDRVYSVDLPASFYSRTDTEPLRKEEDDQPF